MSDQNCKDCINDNCDNMGLDWNGDGCDSYVTEIKPSELELMYERAVKAEELIYNFVMGKEGAEEAMIATVNKALK